MTRPEEIAEVTDYLENVNTLREWRDRNAITRKELADKLDCAWQTIRAWEEGRNYPSASLRRKLAAIIGISTKELYDAMEEKRAIRLPGEK